MRSWTRENIELLDCSLGVQLCKVSLVEPFLRIDYYENSIPINRVCLRATPMADNGRAMALMPRLRPLLGTQSS
jgi:hypothetical protein